MKKLLVLLVGLLIISTVTAVTITWKEIVWNDYSSAGMNVNANDELEVTPVGTGYGAAHYNTPLTFRASLTPWVEVTVLDPGTGRIQMWMEDENYVTPNGGAWMQIGAWNTYTNYQVYWWDYDTYISSGGTTGWGYVDTGIPRTGGIHTFKIGIKEGIVYFYIDGQVISAATGIITPNYFGDIYLAGRDLSGSGQVFTFINYLTGTDFDPITTKAQRLLDKGVKGKGLSKAPGLQKEIPNDNFAGG